MQKEYSVLLVENSNNEHNKIRAELAPLLLHQQKPFVELIYTGEWRPGHRQDITAEEAIDIVKVARENYDLAIVDLALQPVYANNLRHQLDKSSVGFDLDSVLMGSLDGLIVVGRLRKRFPAMPIIVFSQYAAYPVVQRVLLKLLERETGRSDFVRFLQKDEEHYKLLMLVVREELSTNGGGGRIITRSGLWESAEKIAATLVEILSTGDTYRKGGSNG